MIVTAPFDVRNCRLRCHWSHYVELRSMLGPAGVVFIVDDDPCVRESLSSLIRSIGLTALVFASVGEFLSYRRCEIPSCLVLDVRLPGLGGLELQRILRTAGECLPVIFITGFGDIPMSVRAMKAGAFEFLTKPFREQDLLDSISQALAYDAKMRSSRAEVARVRNAVDMLTARERQVMDGLLAGQLNKQVAASLGISEVTVKLHRSSLMKKMSVASLVQLARLTERLR